MKVIHIIDSLQIGGAEKVMVNLCNLLFKNKVNVSAMILGDVEGPLASELHSDILRFRLKRKNKFDLFTAFRMVQQLSKADIAHVHMRHNYAYVALFSKLFLCKTKIVLHDHYGSIEFDKSVPKLFKFLKPKYYIGVSKKLTNWAVVQLKLPEDKVFLLNNTIQRTTKKTNISLDEGLNILMVGNIKPVKNQLFAIKLMQHIDGSLTIYGKNQDETYFNKLITEINRLSLKDKVSFIHDETNIQNCLANYNFAIHTAKSESGPLVLIEYLAQNIPFLAYKTGDVSEVLMDEIPNQFINDFNKKKWEQSILAIKSSHKKTEVLYDRYFSPKQYINTCKGIYAKII